MNIFWHARGVRGDTGATGPSGIVNDVINLTGDTLEVDGSLALPANGAIYFGDPAVDGSARLRIANNVAIVEVRAEGEWSVPT